MRLLIVALTGVGLALGVLLGTPDAPTSMAAPVRDAGMDAGPRFPEPGGKHWRLTTAHGPVHVWIPDGFRPETAGIAVYVHGYYTRVDRAWREHHLAAQFAASERNALFIVPEAPARGAHAVSWLDLGDLIREVRRHARLPRSWGPVVALGHSGAYRTLIEWLDYRPLGHVVLIDGLYGQEAPFRAWLEDDKQPPNRLTVVSLDTLRWSELMMSEIPDARHLDWVPEDPRDLEPAVRDARVVHIRSQYGHMDMITQGKALPVLLRMSGLPALPGAAGSE